MKESTLLRSDQKRAIDFLYGRDKSLLFADIGTGKTVIALSVMQFWLRDKIADRILVVAPTRVCTDVWEEESLGWSHLDLDVLSVAGTPAKFRRSIFDTANHKVVCINYENLPWLMKEYPNGIPGFNAIWFDEVDKMKNPASLRFKGRGARDLKPGSRAWLPGENTFRSSWA